MLASTSNTGEVIKLLTKSGVDGIRFHQRQLQEPKKTGFERDYMRRMIPFYTYLRGNVPLQLESLVTQPGKYAAFAKANQAAMGNQTAPDWTGNWDITAQAGEGYFYDLRTPASDLDKFSQYTDAISSPAQTEEDLYRKLKALEMFTPAVKGPAEVATGWNFFAQKPYEPGSFAGYDYGPGTEAALSNIVGRPYSTAVGFEGVQQYGGTAGNKQKVEDFAVKQTTSTSRYKAQTRKDLEAQFNAAIKRKNDFTWQQRFEGWERDEMASPLSGIPDELQGGHIQAVAEGGLPIMENFLTMTKEENAEQTASQLFRLGLPEKEFKQEEFWEEMKVKEGTKLAESTLSTTKKLEKEGKWVNNAVKEKLEYDAKKAINIQLYSRELAKIRMQLDWAQRRLRNEQASMERKRKDPDFKGDKWSERQIQALEWFIPRYQAQYRAIENLREQERVKEFELPEQIIQGENYDKGMLGKERAVNIRGKGPALADPEQIKDMVKYDEIALERAVVLEDVAIIDLPKYVPKQIRDSIKKPSGPEWKEKQDKAAWYARVIWGDESEVPNEPEPMEKSEEGWAVSPFMPMASVAMINMGTGRKSLVPGFNKSLKTPASPLESSNGVESPDWNLRIPSVSDVVGLFLPHPAAAEPVSEEAIQQKSDMAKEAFLESDEFITAVQSIVTDYLDRGIER